MIFKLFHIGNVPYMITDTVFFANFFFYFNTSFFLNKI